MSVLVSTAIAWRKLQQKGCPGLRGCGKLLVKTQFENKSEFQHFIAPGKDICLLNEMVPMSERCLF